MIRRRRIRQMAEKESEGIPSLKACPYKRKHRHPVQKNKDIRCEKKLGIMLARRNDLPFLETHDVSAGCDRLCNCPRTLPQAPYGSFQGILGGGRSPHARLQKKEEVAGRQLLPHGPFRVTCPHLSGAQTGHFSYYMGNTNSVTNSWP